MTTWLFYMSIAIDQLANAILGGYPDETLSARCYREQRWQRYVIDGLFFWQYRLVHNSGSPDRWQGHCEQCYEYEQRRMDMPEEYRPWQVKTLNLRIDDNTKIIYHDTPAEK